MIRRVFGPLGDDPDHTGVSGQHHPWRARAYVHRDSLSLAQNAPYVDNSYKWAGGGFLSTAEDLARMGRNLLDGRVLRRETAETLWTSRTLRDGSITGYGVGWSTRTDSLGRRVVGHT